MGLNFLTWKVASTSYGLHSAVRNQWVSSSGCLQQCLAHCAQAVGGRQSFLQTQLGASLRPVRNPVVLAVIAMQWPQPQPRSLGLGANVWRNNQPPLASPRGGEGCSRLHCALRGPEDRKGLGCALRTRKLAAGVLLSTFSAPVPRKVSSDRHARRGSEQISPEFLPFCFLLNRAPTGSTQMLSWAPADCLLGFVNFCFSPLESSQWPVGHSQPYGGQGWIPTKAASQSRSSPQHSQMND